MASDNTVEAHSNKDTAQDPGLEVVEEEVDTIAINHWQ